MNDPKGQLTERLKLVITPDPIDSSIAGQLATPLDGAVVTFLGVVRGATDGKAVAGLDYEAYEEMAMRELNRIAEEAVKKWSISKIAIIHRTGSLEVGDISVAIAVSAPHRGEAFDACEFLIDTLKVSVPIWKKELFQDGSSSWVEHA
jgi:molybdopterin synthase catalytic subunit